MKSTVSPRENGHRNPEAVGPWEFMAEPMDLPYEKLPLKDLPSAKEYQLWDKRTCGCPLPMAIGKKHRALGRGAKLRLCCVARALESFMELPTGTLYAWMEFAPDWKWGIDQESTDSTTGETITRGLPPDWLLSRFQEKEIDIEGDEEFYVVPTSE